MSKKPSYSPGQKVYIYGKLGTVVGCINADDPRDVELQGFRYYVDAGWIRWSALESTLKMSTSAISKTQ